MLGGGPSATTVRAAPMAATAPRRIAATVVMRSRVVAAGRASSETLWFKSSIQVAGRCAVRRRSKAPNPSTWPTRTAAAGCGAAAGAEVVDRRAEIVPPDGVIGGVDDAVAIAVGGHRRRPQLVAKSHLPDVVIVVVDVAVGVVVAGK